MTLSELRAASNQVGQLTTLMNFNKRCVTWRRYGINGELRRPMIHRFEVKGGERLSVLLAQNFTLSNPFFKRFCKR